MEEIKNSGILNEKICFIAIIASFVFSIFPIIPLCIGMIILNYFVIKSALARNQIPEIIAASSTSIFMIIQIVYSFINVA